MTRANIFATNRNALDGVLLLLRFTLAVVYFPHGTQKLFGWFGGPGFAAALALFSSLHVPAVLAILAILAESVGALFIFFGFLTRISALALGVDILVAASTVHVKNGFFMNWTGHQRGEGIEFFIFALAFALTLAAAGPGRFSVDHLIFKDRERRLRRSGRGYARGRY